MIQRIIHRLLLRRHFWRYATFSEVAELYASRLMRMFALRLIAVFTSVYLYEEGFSLLFITLFWAAFYGLKIVFSLPAALLVAKYGPKHTTLVSNILSALSMVFLPFAPEYGLWVLIPWNILQALSGAANNLAYNVNFSKVKSAVHAGKEIGYMNIFEKIATGLSPLIGGLLAALYGPESTMVLSALLFLMSAIPLFFTGEPVRVRQKLKFRGFPWRTTWRSLVAQTAIGFDVYVTGTVWSLFMVVVIFTSGTDAVYAKIGALTSVTVIAALASSYAFGKMIDRRRGLELLRFGAITNSIMHLIRPFISTPAGVALMNTGNEAATTGYNMAFTRGMFDTADNSGHRIVYMWFIEMTINLGAMLATLVLAGLLLLLDGATSLRVLFVATAFVTLLIMTPRFMLYRK